MNCMYETVASLILQVRKHFVPIQTGEYDLCRAEDNLEVCKATLSMKEREISNACAQLAKDALQRRKANDLDGAKQKLRERKRQMTRLEKLRNSLQHIDRQLDALQSANDDSEIMKSLKLSSQAMKKAGIRGGVEEAERVMNELDRQIRQSSELTTVLAAPISDDIMADTEADAYELDVELGLLEEAGAQASAPPAPAPPVLGEPSVEPPRARSEALHHRRMMSEDGYS